MEGMTFKVYAMKNGVCPYQTFTPDTPFTAECIDCDLIDDELCNLDRCTLYQALIEEGGGDGTS